MDGPDPTDHCAVRVGITKSTSTVKGQYFLGRSEEPSLNLFQRPALRLRYESEDKDRPQQTDRAVSPERSRITESVVDQRKGIRQREGCDP